MFVIFYWGNRRKGLICFGPKKTPQKQKTQSDIFNILKSQLLYLFKQAQTVAGAT